MDSANRATFVELESTITEDRAAADRVLEEIRRLKLETYAWELDSVGYTVLPPDRIGSTELTDALRCCVLELSEAESGIRPNIVSGESHTAYRTNLGRAQQLQDVIFQGVVFERALMARPVLALISYLLGESFVLAQMTGAIKGPGPENVVRACK